MQFASQPFFKEQTLKRTNLSIGKAFKAVCSVFIFISETSQFTVSRCPTASPFRKVPGCEIGVSHLLCQPIHLTSRSIKKLTLSQMQTSATLDNTGPDKPKTSYACEKMKPVAEVFLVQGAMQLGLQGSFQ